MRATRSGTVPSMEAILASMEAKWRWMLVTAIAPIAWGSNYYVTRHALPPDHALYGALLRALPAGLFLLAVRPRRPRGAWWWRSAVLGALNVGAFFALIYVTAQLLPTNVASMIMATSPIALMLLAWPLLGERPRVLPASARRSASWACSSCSRHAPAAWIRLGRWRRPRPWRCRRSATSSPRGGGPTSTAPSLTGWAAIAGGLLLAPAAIVAEGAPPALDGTAVLGFAYVSVVATALAFWAWFEGLRASRRRDGRPRRAAQSGHRRPARHDRGRRGAGRPPAARPRAGLRRDPDRPACAGRRHRSMASPTCTTGGRTGRNLLKPIEFIEYAARHHPSSSRFRRPSSAPVPTRPSWSSPSVSVANHQTSRSASRSRRTRSWSASRRRGTDSRRRPAERFRTSPTPARWSSSGSRWARVVYGRCRTAGTRPASVSAASLSPGYGCAGCSLASTTLKSLLTVTSNSVPVLVLMCDS